MIRFDEAKFDPLVFDCDLEDRFWLRNRRRRRQSRDYVDKWGVWL